MIVLEPESKIVSISFSVITVSRSIKISFLSMETTSPVSSSTKSSCHVFKTLAASRRPTVDFNVFLSTFNSSAKPKRSKMSLSFPYPIARSNTVTGNFFLRSMYAYMTLFTSVANSIQEPLNGIIRAEYNFVPFVCFDCAKNTPGERCSWDTITRSAPLITNDPRSVI